MSVGADTHRHIVQYLVSMAGCFVLVLKELPKQDFVAVRIGVDLLKTHSSVLGDY